MVYNDYEFSDSTRVLEKRKRDLIYWNYYNGIGGGLNLVLTGSTSIVIFCYAFRNLHYNNAIKAPLSLLFAAYLGREVFRLNTLAFGDPEKLKMLSDKNIVEEMKKIQFKDILENSNISLRYI